MTRERERIGVSCPEPGKTKQSEKNACDINLLTKKWLAGQQPPLPKGPAAYGDFTSATDYFHASLQVIEARKAFDTLPAVLRTRFQNDPGELLAFILNDDNYDEALELGLVERKPDPEEGTPPPPEPDPIEPPPGS